MRTLYAVSQPAGATIREITVERAHAFTRAELVALSSKGAVQRAVASGALTRLLPGIYAAAEHADSFHARADAALLWAGPEAAISGESALFVWGLVDSPPRMVEITVPQERRPRPPEWLRVRRVTVACMTTRVGRLAVVTPAEAIVQGYGAVEPSARAEVVFGAVRTGLAGPTQISQVLRRTPRVKRRRSLERRVAAAARGAHSFLEERGLVAVFTTSEYADVVRQHEVVIEGSRYVLDMFDAASRTAIELDGTRFHSGVDARLRDIRRDAHLATVGIQTLRFCYADLMERPEWCRQIARETLAVRACRRS